MSKRRYHRRSKMKRRGVKNGSQNGSKMAPKWLQNGSKMAPWRPLGGPWARPCCQTLPGAVPERLWHGPGSPKIHLGGLGTPLERKVDRFHPPGWSPGGSWRGSGESYWKLLAVGPAGTKKETKTVPNFFFVQAIFACVF